MPPISAAFMPRMFRRDLWRALVRVVRVEHGRLRFAASLAPVVASAEDALPMPPVMPSGASQSHCVAFSPAIRALERCMFDVRELDELVRKLEDLSLSAV